MSVVTNHQYEPPKLPPEWTGDEKKFYTRLIDILDEIYSKYGRLSLTDLSPAVRKVISGMVDGTTFETAIEQLQDSISLKASQSTVDALGQQVSSNTAAITLVPGQITSAVTAIQVGGRNLIRNSELIEMPAYTSGFTNTELYRGLEPGKTYTLSIGTIVQTSGTAQEYLHVAVNSTLGNTPQSTTTFHVGTERMWWVFTVPEDDLLYRLIMYNGMGAHAENKAYELHEVQLEIGNKATAWSPAPEDTDAAITATRSQITQTASEIRAEVSDISIGGTNLLRGTNTTTALSTSANAQWTKGGWRSASSGTGVRESVAITMPPSGNLKRGWHLTMTSGSGDTTLANGVAIGQNNIPVTAGETYTFSCYAKGAGRVCMALGVSTFAGVHTTLKNTGTWERVKATITLPSGTAYISTSGKANAFFGATATNSDFIICGMKLEAGNKATDWSESPEDISSALSGMDNLYVTGDSVSGYLTAGGGIAGGGTSLTETTSDYIAVTPGETLTFQCWVTPETGSTNYLWMAYGFFDSSKTWLSSPGRTAQTQGAGTGTAQYRYITFTVPAGAAYIRISGRMYADGRMKLEQNAEPTPYRDATAEIVNTSMTINRKGFFVNTSGIVGINAVDSNNESYIYLGDILELDDQGGLKARVGNFTQSLKVGGKQVAALPYPVIFSRTTPTQTGVIWIQPTAAISAQFSSPSDTSRNSRLHFGYYGSTSASLPAFTFSAVGTDTVSGTGNKTYRLEFDIYSLTDLSSVTASFSATATKSGSTVTFGTSSTYTLKKYQLEHITLTATSTTNLCSNTSAITVTIKAAGSNLNKIFVQSNQTMLLNCAAAASSGQQACNLIFIP